MLSDPIDEEFRAAMKRAEERTQKLRERFSELMRKSSKLIEEVQMHALAVSADGCAMEAKTAVGQQLRRMPDEFAS